MKTVKPKTKTLKVSDGNGEPILFYKKVSKNTPPPPAAEPETQPPATAPTSKLITTPFSEIEAKPMEWLWRDHIPLNMVTVLDGDPGTGKSTLVIDLAARLSRGDTMPDGSPGMQGKTLLFSSEDSPEYTIKPRLQAAGATMENVLMFKEVDEGAIYLANAAHQRGLEAFIKKNNIKLVIIDVFMSYLGAADSSKDQEMRARVLDALKRIAENTHCAIILLRHLNKGTSRKALYRGGGSVGIGGAARAVWIVGYDPADESLRVLAPEKVNVAEKPTSLAYRLESVELSHGCKAARIKWCGESTLTANDLVAEPDDREDSEEKEHQKTQVELCADWLHGLLQKANLSVAQAKSDGLKVGFQPKTIQRAATKLGVKNVWINNQWTYRKVQSTCPIEEMP